MGNDYSTLFDDIELPVEKKSQLGGSLQSTDKKQGNKFKKEGGPQNGNNNRQQMIMGKNPNSKGIKKGFGQ